MQRKHFAIAIWFLPCVAAAQGLFANDPAAQFTPEQAARGQAAYGRACVSCHGAALEGGQFGVALKGAAFESHWRGQTRAAFSEKIRTTMPPRGLGSVSGQAYSDIEAYILQVNSRTGPNVTLPLNAELQAAAAQRGDTGPLHQAVLAARTAKLAMTPVTDAMLRNPSPADWLIWRRTYDGQGYSPLALIDRSNVAKLRSAWSWSLPDSMNEITPLVHDGVMFIYSGPVVQALDAVNGDLLWQYLRVLPDEFDNGRGGRVKTLADVMVTACSCPRQMATLWRSTCAPGTCSGTSRSSPRPNAP